MAEPIGEDSPKLVSADGSLEVMQRGLDVVMQELYDHMVKILIHRVRVIQSVQRDEGHRIKATSQQTAAMSKRIGTTMLAATCSRMTQDAINELIDKHVEEALKAYNAARNPATKTEMKNDQQDDNVEVIGNNGNGFGNGNGNPNVNNEGVIPVTRECTYQDFVKCQPMNFKGTEGFVGLTRWFEKMEMVFHISNCPPRTVSVDVAYAMTWKALMKLITKVYCPGNKIQKMQTELWNLIMVPKEEDQVEKYIGGLPDNIQGNVITAEPNVARAYTVGNNVERRRYARALPYCRKCRMLPEGPCMVKCVKCKRVGHMTRDCKSTVAATTQRAPVGNQTGNTCYECGRQGHYRNERPKLRNQNRGNKTGNNEAKAKAYVIGGGGSNPNSNVITNTFLLNNCYATILFDSGADRSFILTTFSALLDVILPTLDVSYVAELADGRISKTNVMLRGCTLGLLGHPFDIDLMPVELGSFDVFICMDWLAKYHAVIVCDEKIIRIPYGDEVLIIIGDGCNGGIPHPRELRFCLSRRKMDLFGCVSTTLQGSRVDYKIDLGYGYHQLRVREEDIPNTTFRTRYGHYKFQVMPFGLTDALTVFMDLMNWVCKPYLDKLVIVFIDDISIYSKNKKEHEGHLKLILRLLKEEKLFAKFFKCEFWLSTVKFLFHLIDSEGIHVDPANIESVKDWASPKTPTEIR
ncbi:putative reverse transcriptase domain-containing protein [Tanacetum coccineum]